jgi:hypothetical protein
LLRLSVLRAAYLVGIAVGGYRWIPIWDAIRRQTLDSTIHDARLSGLVRYEKVHSRDRRALGIIETPVEMHSFHIGFGRWTVFLPRERESALYHPEKLAGQRIEFKGLAYDWPTAPTFGYEWRCPAPTQEPLVGPRVLPSPPSTDRTLLSASRARDSSPAKRAEGNDHKQANAVRPSQCLTDLRGVVVITQALGRQPNDNLVIPGVRQTAQSRPPLLLDSD